MSRPVHRLTARSLRVGANGTKAEFTGLDREYLGPFAQDRFFGVICNGRGLQPWNLAQEGDNPSDSSVNRGVDLDSDLLVWGGAGFNIYLLPNENSPRPGVRRRLAVA